LDETTKIKKFTYGFYSATVYSYVLILNFESQLKKSIKH